MHGRIMLPALRAGVPVWFHPRGRKMAVGAPLRTMVVLESTAARLTISPLDAGRRWALEWNITFSKTERVAGVIGMTTKRLELAFQLHEDWHDEDPPSLWMYQDCGCTVGYQGYFIRYDTFLNIPGPGTGHDGDPNISIELSDPIKAVVQALIATRT